MKDRLVAALQAHDPALKAPGAIIERRVSNPWSAKSVQDATREILNGAHLHYSGGTKVMAANARMLFRECGGANRDTSYLDERHGLLRFDDGYDEPLAERNVDLDVERVLQLHGIAWTARAGKDGDPTPEDAAALARAALAEPQLAGQLYDLFSWSGARWKELRAASKPVPAGMGLSVSSIGGAGWSESRAKHWCKFLAGEWLEEWVRLRLGQLAPGAAIATGVEGVRQERKFEVDVVMVRGHRLYVASCTTDGWNGKIGYCKSKLFEATMRGKQLGGDLARTALVSMLHGATEGKENIAQLQRDASDTWDSPNATRVFGLEDLRLWRDDADGTGLDGLREWIRS